MIGDMQGETSFLVLIMTVCQHDLGCDIHVVVMKGQLENEL